MDRLTRANLNATKYSPNEDALDEQIMILSEMIDAAPQGARHDWLCSAFQALQWARCPTGFAPPSQSQEIQSQ